MHVKIRHLEVFDALMKSGSISHAAKRLNVTQPAVSVALSNFETELGFRLFHRAKGFFAPTGEALLLHAQAEQGLLALANIERRALEIRAGATGGVSIASNGALAINLLPGLIADFQRDHPSVSVDLKIRSSRQIADWVSSRQIDIGLIDAPAPVAGLSVEIAALPCVCILREDDPLAARETIGPRCLAGRSVIAITGDHPIDRRLDAVLADRDVAVERRVIGSYFAIARNLVRAGAGVALVDGINGRMAMADGVTWRPFAPRIDFELAIITPRDVPLRDAAAEFYARLEAAIAPYLAPG